MTIELKQLVIRIDIDKDDSLTEASASLAKLAATLKTCKPSDLRCYQNIKDSNDQIVGTYTAKIVEYQGAIEKMICS